MAALEPLPRSSRIRALLNGDLSPQRRLSVVGAARTLYSNVLGRGRDVRFAADTPLQLQLAPGAPAARCPGAVRGVRSAAARRPHDSRHPRPRGGHCARRRHRRHGAARDAVRFAENYLHDHATRDRRALLIVTDGKDNSSTTTMKEIEFEAGRSGTTVCGIGLFPGGSGAAKDGRHELETITSRTGGVAYYPADITRIDTVALDLARQIRQQYTIGYTPAAVALDGAYRTIRVTAASPVRGERLSVRTRAGYRANPAATGR